MSNLPPGVTDAMIDAQWGDVPDDHFEECASNLEDGTVDLNYCDCAERQAEIDEEIYWETVAEDRAASRYGW